MECIDGRTRLRICGGGPPSFCERHDAGAIRCIFSIEHRVMVSRRNPNALLGRMREILLILRPGVHRQRLPARERDATASSTTCWHDH